MTLKFEHLQSCIDKIIEDGSHFKFIVNKTDPKLCIYRENFMDIPIDDFAYLNSSEVLVHIRIILLEKINETIIYVDDKIKESLKINTHIDFIYSKLDDKSYNLLILERDKLRKLKLALCYYLLDNLKQQDNVNVPLGNEKEELKILGVNVKEKWLNAAWYYICGDGKENVPFYFDTNFATKFLAEYFNNIYNCLVNTLKTLGVNA